MNRRTLALPHVYLRAEVAAADTAKRSAAVTFYTGVPIERFDFLDGPYTLRFALDGADLSRLNAGAPLTRDHSRDLADVVGVIDRAWIASGAARAVVRFSDREDVAVLWRDVEAGIVRNVSMEAALLEIEDVTPKGGKPALLAKKWQPIALSIVSVGADPGAQIAALADGPTHPCVMMGGRMETDITTPAPSAEELAAEKQRKAALVREGEIHRLSRAFGCGDLWAARMIASADTVDEILVKASEERAKRAPSIRNEISWGTDYESVGERLASMADGLAARAQGKEPTERGRRYAELSLAEAAAEMLSARGLGQGLDPRRHAGRVVALALTSSDYPLLLANTGSKVLAAAYEAAAPTYRMLARRQDLKDFKTNSYLKVGDFPVLLQVGEEGEIKLGSFSESAETWALATYGRIVSFARQAIVNDDLGAFQRMLDGAAQRIAAVENGLFFTRLTSGTSNNGPTMADGAQFFATGHANLASSGAAIDVTTLGAGRAAMQKQTSLDGIKLNIVPRYLLTSPDKRTIAEQYTTQITPALPSSVNPFPGRLEVVSDANLPTANPWYLFADPAAVPAAVYGHLESEPGPRLETRVGFEVEGLQMKVAIDFAVAFVEHRAAWRNPGA